VKKPTKIILWVVGILLVLIITFLIALPEFFKSYIQENDQKLIGREIFIEDIDINLFTGLIRVERFDLKEADGKEPFVSFNLLELNLQLWDLFKNSLYVESCYLDRFYCNIEQNGSHFNFDDILSKLDFASTDNSADSAEVAESMSFTVQNVNVRGSSFKYKSDLLSEITFDSIQVSVPVASDTMDAIYSEIGLNISTGGSLTFRNIVNLPETYFDVLMEGENLDLRFLKAYADPFVEISQLNGFLNSELYIGGSWTNPDIFNLGGELSIQDFLITDKQDQKLVGYKEFIMDIDSIRMNEALYKVDKLTMTGFSGVFELYDEGDNFTNCLRDTSIISSTEESADQESTEDHGLSDEDYSNPFLVTSYYLKDITKSYQNSSYKIDEIDISESSFEIHDFTTSNPFRYSLTDMTLHADSIDSQNEFLTINLSSVLNNTGTFDATLKMHTENLKDIDLHYEISGTDLTAFSPYTSDYVDYPIELGDLEYVNDTRIRDGIIVSQNIINANQFNWGDRSDGDAYYNLPVRLAVSLLKDLDGNIHLDVPIEGDLNDPEYKLGKVIWSTVKNILLKAVSAPFRLIAGMFKMDEEDLKKINFGLIQFRLDKHHEKQLDDLYKVLSNKTDLNLEFKRVTKKYEEVERYAMDEAKYRYLFHETNIPEPEDVSKDQSKQMNDLDIKDSLFVEFVSSKLPESYQEQPIQKKCIEWVGMERAIEKTDRIGKKRMTAIETYLLDDKGLEPERLRFTVLPEDSLITHRSNTIFNVSFWVEE